MRDRIARHMPAKSPWDFKHLPGGLFDIDFVAQYLALRHAAERPDLLDPHPAEMLRRMATAGLLEQADAERLRGDAHAAVGRAEPAAAHPERRRGGVRRKARRRRASSA